MLSVKTRIHCFYLPDLPTKIRYDTMFFFMWGAHTHTYGPRTKDAQSLRQLSQLRRYNTDSTSLSAMKKMLPKGWNPLLQSKMRGTDTTI